MHRLNPLYWLGAFRKPQGFRPQHWAIVRLLRHVYMPLLQRMATFHVRASGTDYVPRHGGVIVAANHPTVWDPLAVFAAIDRNLAFIAKAELWRNKWLGPVLNLLGHIPVDRGNRDSGAKAQAMALAILCHRGGRKHRRNRGGVMAMFPEGGTTPPSGVLRQFKKGVWYLARESGRPVVPCGVNGTENIRYRGFRYIWKHRQPVQVTVRFGAPLYARDYDGPDAELRFLRDLRRQIELLRQP